MNQTLQQQDLGHGLLPARIETTRALGADLLQNLLETLDATCYTGELAYSLALWRRGTWQLDASGALENKTACFVI
jgi:hypothetical protein